MGGMIRYTIVVLGLALLAGCQWVISGGTGLNEDTYLRDLAYIDLASGEPMALLQPMRGAKQLKVIDNEADYHAELAIFSAGPAPSVNFNTHFVIALEMGWAPSAGYSLSPMAVEEHSDGIRVLALTTVPGDGCMVASVLTYPYHFIAVPRHRGPVLFQESLVKGSCI